jgi:UDP-glucose 4-epimerase
MRVLITGAAGFLSGYVILELLEAGHEVIGLDDLSKYGPVKRSFDGNPRYRFVVGDAKDVALMTELALQCDQILAAAAMVGGVGYIQRFAYDLLAENERITAATFDAAITAFRKGRLRKITVVSSSMVFESASRYPVAEADLATMPPPRSSYGFQKLASEYFARAAFDQYGLPFTIARAINCVGIGERRDVKEGRLEGNTRIATGHVIPDLVRKVCSGQDPLRILGDGLQTRQFTYAGDLARGMRLCLELDAATNEDLNLSTSRVCTIRELAEMIWRRVRGDEPLRLAHDPALAVDVRRSELDVRKAKRLLGWEATTTLESILDELIPWMRAEMAAGRL